MQIPFWILLLTTFFEIILFLAVLLFFKRIKKSENLLLQLQKNQDKLLRNLHFNAELEQELVESFNQRQQELTTLNIQLEARAKELKKLLTEAEGMTRSPNLLKEIIITGYKAGRSIHDLAKATSLSKDEVTLILTKLSQGSTN